MYREEFQAGPVGVGAERALCLPALQSLPRHHVIHHKQKSFDLDLSEMEWEDPRIVVDAAKSQGFWDSARRAYQGQLPHGDRLWRITFFGGIYTVALSRIGSYLPDNKPFVRDVCLTTAMPNHLLDTLTLYRRSASFTAALDNYLDDITEETRQKMAQVYQWLPLPSGDESTGYYLEPLSLKWLSTFKIQNIPRGLKTAFLVRVKDAVLLCGDSYTQDQRPISWLWQQTIDLAMAIGAGIPTSLYMLGAHNAVVIEPSACGSALLVTVWYKVAPIPDILKASERTTNAISPSLRKAYQAI